MSLRMVSVDSSGTFVKEIFCFSMDFIEFFEFFEFFSLSPSCEN